MAGRKPKNWELMQKLHDYTGNYEYTSYFQVLKQICLLELLLERSFYNNVSDKSKIDESLFKEINELIRNLLNLRHFVEDHYFDVNFDNLHTYPIPKPEYEKLYNLQNGCCKICGEHRDRLQVDHDHDTGKVRGLLCNTCNTGIGMLKDKPKNFNKAYEYLRNHKRATKDKLDK
jgi:hypothetical protein